MIKTKATKTGTVSSPEHRDRSDPFNRIWEIHGHYKCPVVGACLSLEEHRKILKKTTYQTKKLRPYELHRIIVSHLDNENRISLKVDRFFKHKYRNVLTDLGELDEKEFMTAWRDYFDSGDVSGIFYVAALKRNLSEETLTEIYGDIHMARHFSLEELMQTKRNHMLQTEVNRKLAKLLKHEKCRSKNVKKENAQLKTSLCETQRLLKNYQSSRKVVSNEQRSKTLRTENQSLQDKLKKMEDQNSRQVKQLKFLEREKQRLQIKLFDLQSTNQLLADEISGLIDQLSIFTASPDHCAKYCPKSQLCAKRILIVGGISKIKHLYRDLVESSGGEFEYHDGYLKNKKHNLEARVSRSDLIICPVNCNSHVACQKVKALCKKLNKPVKMLPSSSLSAISNALFEKDKEVNSVCQKTNLSETIHSSP